MIARLPRAAPAFAGWLSQTNDVTSVFLAAGQNPRLINPRRRPARAGAVAA